MNIVFTTVTYPVSFTESGLASGAQWAVTATDVATQVEFSGQSTGTAIGLRLTVGTYALSATGPSGYSVRLSTTEVAVTGAGQAPIRVTFVASPAGVVAPSSFPWLTTGTLGVVALVAILGAGWGYSRYRYTQGKQEGLAWVNEFHDDAARLDQRPPR
jgi:hypothetical protein